MLRASGFLNPDALSVLSVDRLFRNDSAQFLAKLVDLLKHLLGKSGVVCLLVALRMISLALELVVEINSLVDYL